MFVIQNETESFKLGRFQEWRKEVSYVVVKILRSSTSDFHFVSAPPPHFLVWEIRRSLTSTATASINCFFVQLNFHANQKKLAKFNIPRRVGLSKTPIISWAFWSAASFQVPIQDIERRSERTKIKEEKDCDIIKYCYRLLPALSKRVLAFLLTSSTISLAGKICLIKPTPVPA